ncbi:Hypothetical predicted protein [Mytilus galloprovincialis]|nr:Hypothetical predicted protein [Mytilus galloprovincialis]
MWGEKAQMTVPVRETSIRIKNIEVNNYKGQIEGNSTSLTEIEIDAEEEEIQGEVEGASFEENDMWIVVNRTLYNIKNNIMETLFPGYKFIPGKEITASVKGYKLTKLFQKNKRTKKE